MIRKALITIDKSVDRVVLLVSLLFFLICGYAMLDAYHVYYNASDTSLLKYKPAIGSDASVMRDLSDDVVAWLTIDGTNIDYPIMQGEDNSEYLNKNPYGDFSLSGSIFLDSRCDGTFQQDSYYLVYGHHMDYGAMFGALDKFIQPDYFNAHKTGTLVTAQGQRFSVSFFACTKAMATENAIFGIEPDSKAKALAYLQRSAAVFQPDASKENLDLLALSTCQSAENIERIIVCGYLNPIDAN